MIGCGHTPGTKCVAGVYSNTAVQYDTAVGLWFVVYRRICRLHIIYTRCTAVCPGSVRGMRGISTLNENIKVTARRAMIYGVYFYPSSFSSSFPKNILRSSSYTKSSTHPCYYICTYDSAESVLLLLCTCACACAWRCVRGRGGVCVGVGVHKSTNISSYLSPSHTCTQAHCTTCSVNVPQASTQQPPPTILTPPRMGTPIYHIIQHGGCSVQVHTRRDDAPCRLSVPPRQVQHSCIKYLSEKNNEASAKNRMNSTDHSMRDTRQSVTTCTCGRDYSKIKATVCSGRGQQSDCIRTIPLNLVPVELSPPILACGTPNHVPCSVHGNNHQVGGAEQQYALAMLSPTARYTRHILTDVLWQGAYI